jgi:predicted RNA-binding Zn-ribbon protein involved in translation (DUF1610 family)
MTAKKEIIRCPKCGTVQVATVGLTQIWNTYCHTCISCKHIIMESEWDRVSNEEIMRNISGVN